MDTERTLRMMWLASTTLPVGGFSYSEGLEAAVDAGLVRDEAQALDWLRGQLTLTLARSDLPVVLRAHRAWWARDLESLRAVQGWILATRESSELRQQTLQMGRSLVAWLRGLQPDHPALPLCVELRPAPCWTCAFALAALAFDLDAAQAAQTLAFSWLDSQVQSALRCVPLGQGAGQRLLAALTPLLPAAIAHATSIRDHMERWQSYSPMLAILSSRHETQYSRLFRS